MTKIDRISKNTAAAHLPDGRVFILSNMVDGSLSQPHSNTIFRNDYRDWEVLPQTVGDYRIVPYGWDNNVPIFLRNAISDNNLAPGILGRQQGLLWGQGPHLFRTAIKDGQITQEWVEDAEVQRWLESWGYKDYLLGVMTDYLHTGGYFDKKYLRKGHRIGLGCEIAKLEHIPIQDARLEWPDNDSNRIEDCKHIIEGDFTHWCYNTGVKVYPIFDPKDPGRYPVAASYNRLRSFARDFYSIPQFWGALRWIVRGSEIPSIFKYVTDNGINLAYHVHSTQAYWDYRRQALRNLHPDWLDEQIEAEIMNITVQMLESMTKVLTGKENAGKMFHSIDCMDDTGTLQKWEIEPIDQKIKDFVESQLKIAEASVSAITSGMGLHPSLSNIMVNGKLASGSEMLYAFKLYLHSEAEIAYYIMLSSINQAIAINFPEKRLNLGFYHQSVKTEESLSSSDRLKNS